MLILSLPPESYRKKRIFAEKSHQERPRESELGKYFNPRKFKPESLKQKKELYTCVLGAGGESQDWPNSGNAGRGGLGVSSVEIVVRFEVRTTLVKNRCAEGGKKVTGEEEESAERSGENDEERNPKTPKNGRVQAKRSGLDLEQVSEEKKGVSLNLSHEEGCLWQAEKTTERR